MKSHILTPEEWGKASDGALRRHDEALRAKLEAAVTSAHAWEAAVFERYPLGLEWDPTSPRLMVGNVAEGARLAAEADARRLRARLEALGASSTHALMTVFPRVSS
jgi:hypothetical protein